ncbi:uncharacterized protein BO66DRAFT_70735 [Aspergillus aculeatinus CBS 121060]|uniref:Uncharacterized protein n=1 Tax=Aspergillus aculeatinus CBS 121060 TaxID=1448322 RepID=A0ACD1HN05_9EURO|nr:hypothetical protein BO66DRAFT_70735 [Aspergillus aculeatinus CBS 121060]RAH74990.1 hypothetical protein BO66DRAFT_70735 [Aspergillus aculeatinus CBS 121060]
MHTMGDFGPTRRTRDRGDKQRRAYFSDPRKASSQTNLDIVHRIKRHTLIHASLVALTVPLLAGDGPGMSYSEQHRLFVSRRTLNSIMREASRRSSRCQDVAQGALEHGGMLNHLSENRCDPPWGADFSRGKNHCMRLSSVKQVWIPIGR